MIFSRISNSEQNSYISLKGTQFAWEWWCVGTFRDTTRYVAKYNVDLIQFHININLTQKIKHLHDMPGRYFAKDSSHYNGDKKTHNKIFFFLTRKPLCLFYMFCLMKNFTSDPKFFIQGKKYELLGSTGVNFT